MNSLPSRCRASSHCRVASYSSGETNSSRISSPLPVGTSTKTWCAAASKLKGQFVDGREFQPVGPGDGGVDLERQPRLLAGRNPRQGPGVGPLHRPEAIMGAGGGPVQRNTHPLNPHVLEPRRDGRGDQGTVHRHDHAVAEPGAVSRQVEDILPQQGFAAGQDHHHLPHGGQVVQEFEALLGAQLAGIRPGPRRGPAVEASQVAAPGGLPGQEAEGWGS